MFRVINSSNRALAQRIVRSTFVFTRAEASTDAEAGSVASGNDAFSKREHAEEARWARRQDAELKAKFREGHSTGTHQEQLAALEAEKRSIEQQIEQLKRQQR